MKTRKILACLMSSLMVLMLLTSVTVSADTANSNAIVAEQSARYQMYILSDKTHTAPVLQANAPTELNALYPNLRYGIARAICNNKGVTIKLHLTPTAVQTKIPGIFDTASNTGAVTMAANASKGVDLSQTVQIYDNTATFDWDTITKDAGFNGSTGLVSDIWLQSTTDISIEAVEIYVPQRDIKSLAAGASIYEGAALAIGGLK